MQITGIFYFLAPKKKFRKFSKPKQKKGPKNKNSGSFHNQKEKNGPKIKIPEVFITKNK